MILEFIMNILKGFLLFVISLFPALPEMAWLSGSVSSVVGVLASFNRFVDLGAFVSCLLILFAMANIEFIWGVIMWVIRKIPGVS